MEREWRNRRRQFATATAATAAMPDAWAATVKLYDTSHVVMLTEWDGNRIVELRELFTRVVGWLPGLVRECNAIQSDVWQ